MYIVVPLASANARTLIGHDLSSLCESLWEETAISHVSIWVSLQREYQSLEAHWESTPPYPVPLSPLTGVRKSHCHCSHPYGLLLVLLSRDSKFQTSSWYQGTWVISLKQLSSVRVSLLLKFQLINKNLKPRAFYSWQQIWMQTYMKKLSCISERDTCKTFFSAINSIFQHVT